MQDESPPPLPQEKSRSGLWAFLVVCAVLGGPPIGGVNGEPLYHRFWDHPRLLQKVLGSKSQKPGGAFPDPHPRQFATNLFIMRDLKFTGDWDQIALMNVHYYPSANRDAYYIEVERGWMGNRLSRCPPNFGRALVIRHRSNPRARETGSVGGLDCPAAARNEL